MDRERNARERREKFGSGSTGAWTEEELENLPETHATTEGATRDEESPKAQREGRAQANRRKAIGSKESGSAPPYGEGERTGGETKGRRSMHPGERGVRRGAEERRR